MSRSSFLIFFLSSSIFVMTTDALELLANPKGYTRKAVLENLLIFVTSHSPVRCRDCADVHAAEKIRAEREDPEPRRVLDNQA